MAWGAIVGQVFNIAGQVVSANKERTAKNYANKAADVRLQQQTMANAITRRDQIRNFRLQRAEAISAGATENNIDSSAVSGSVSSLSSQASSNLNYFDKQAALDKQYNTLIKASGRYSGQAANWAAIGQTGQALGQLGSTIYNTLNTPTTTTTTSG